MTNDRLTAGLALGAQKNFAANFNEVCDIIQNLRAGYGVKIQKTGTTWEISADGGNTAINNGAGTSSGIPSGYAEMSVVANISWDETNHKITFQRVTALVKSGSEQTDEDLLTFREYDT